MSETVRRYVLDSKCRGREYRFTFSCAHVASTQFKLRAGYPGIDRCELVAEFADGRKVRIAHWPSLINEMAGKV